jgi:hypothetical protein
MAHSATADLDTIYALERNIDFLKGTGTERPTVCYIHTPDDLRPNRWDQIPDNLFSTKIQAVVLERDFFKISIKNLPFHLLRDSYYRQAQQFILPETPKHLWLRFDKSIMSHD